MRKHLALLLIVLVSVMLGLLFFVIFSPISKSNIVETEVAGLEPVIEEISDSQVTVSETLETEQKNEEDTTNENVGKEQEQVIESNFMNDNRETIEDTEVTSAVEATPTVEEPTQLIDNSNDQPQYIGRQPPENYVEPTYLDNVKDDGRRENEEYMNQYNEEFQSYLEQKDAFESNIVIIREDIDPEIFRTYEWIKYSPEDFKVGGYENTLIWVAYAIKTYYNGEVPCDYYVPLDGIYNKVFQQEGSEIYHICEVQTYGEKPLHIQLDKFNYKIRIEEGIKKEE